RVDSMVCPPSVVKLAFHVPARLWSAANTGEFRANANVNAATESEVRKCLRNLMRIIISNFFLLGQRLAWFGLIRGSNSMDPKPRTQASPRHSLHRIVSFASAP